MAWWNPFSKSTGKPKEFVKTYWSQVSQPIPAESRLSGLTFLVIDTETTGLDPRNDFILSYGSVHVKGYGIPLETSKELFLRPKKVDKEAIKVHELIDPKKYISREELVRVFLLDAANHILVGHHIGFDLAMLEKAGKSYGLGKIKNPIVDTMELGIRLEIGKHYDANVVNYQEYSLDAMCERYQIRLDDRHTASGDAFITAQLLIKLLKLAEKKGITNYGELMAR